MAFRCRRWRIDDLMMRNLTDLRGAVLNSRCCAPYWYCQRGRLRIVVVIRLPGITDGLAPSRLSFADTGKVPRAYSRGRYDAVSPHHPHKENRLQSESETAKQLQRKIIRLSGTGSHLNSRDIYSFWKESVVRETLFVSAAPICRRNNFHAPGEGSVVRAQSHANPR